MRSVITYFGGKNNMAKRIIEQFPDKETYDVYVEPFGGSYSVGLNMDYVPPVEIYNDLEKNVYCLYKVLQDEKMFHDFKKLCDLSPYNDTMRLEYKKVLRENKDLPILNRAYMFFYVHRTSFNGIGGFKVNTVIRRNMSKSVSDFLSAIDGLEDIHQRISNLVVCNMDGIELIKRHKDKENVFIYCDPPYVQSTRTSNTRYDIDMTDEQQDEFIEACINAKCKILISGYESEKYQKLIDNGFTKTSFETNHRTEVLWKNY